jgi:hypothetical protein
MEGVARAVTAATAVTPDFATTSTSTTGRADRDFEGNRGASTRLMPRQGDLGSHAIAADIRLDEGMSHPLDFVTYRGKVNRDLVGKRLTDLPIGWGTSLDSDPGMVYTPVVLHSLAP